MYVGKKGTKSLHICAEKGLGRIAVKIVYDAYEVQYKDRRV